jgi:hypothetical protein
MDLRYMLEVVVDPAVCGLLVGAIHHLLFQYPNQANILTTLYAFAFTNVIFVILLLAPKNAPDFFSLGILQIIKASMVFNAVYVCNFHDVSDCRSVPR